MVCVPCSQAKARGATQQESEGNRLQTDFCTWRHFDLKYRSNSIPPLYELQTKIILLPL